MVEYQSSLTLAAVTMQDYGGQPGPKLTNNTTNTIKPTSNRSAKTSPSSILEMKKSAPGCVSQKARPFSADLRASLLSTTC
jgi:hypothetical protein